MISYVPDSADFQFRIAAGDEDKYEAGFIIGHNPNTQGSGVSEVIWDMGDNYTYLTADTQLYASSSDAADTAVSVLVVGLDANLNPVNRVVALNGQTQVALSGLMYRVHAALVTSSTTPVGDVYIAESDTLSAGVPDTDSKIKTQIPLSRGITGAIIDSGVTGYESDNISHTGIYTVKEGYKMIVLKSIASVGNNDEMLVGCRIRTSATSPWLNRNAVPAYQASVAVEFTPPLSLPAGTDIECRSNAKLSGSRVQIQLFFVLEKI